MMDRVLLWELSQIRRHELLELAGARRQREGIRFTLRTSESCWSKPRRGQHVLMKWLWTALRPRSPAPLPEPSPPGRVEPAPPPRPEDAEARIAC
jgi:hypothetical protein